MRLPKKAVVLAAGLGTRLRPLTLVRPKPLLPVWGTSLLERAIRRLERWGVEEIAVNAHHLAPQVRLYSAERRGSAKITVAEEPEILGTGGVLNPLKGWIGGDPFWLVNGDVLAEGLEPGPIAEAFERSGGFAACWLSSEHGPRTVEPDPQGRICNWKSDVPGDWGTATYCGWAMLSPKVIDYLPPSGFSTIVSAYERAMMEDARFVVGVEEKNSWWADCGTLETYLEAHNALDPDRFEANPNVIFPGVKLLDSADLALCVVTGGLIGGSFQQTALVGVSQISSKPLEELSRRLGWPLEDVAAQFLGARGSDREFWRLVRGDDRAIAVIYDDSTRVENARYAGHAAVLSAAGVPVPKVLADVPELKATALEDCGAKSLQDLASDSRANLVKLYTPVMSALKTFHEKGLEKALATEAALEPSFGPDLFKWERDLFEEHCLKSRFGYDAMPDDVRRELEGVADSLSRARPVLLHRDFQSSNVLFRDDGSFAFIDFQGMRLGPAAYDLASVLYDPYVHIEPSARERLRAAYGGVSSEELALGAVQRLVQALGAFGRLASVGQPSFGKHVMPALANLLSAADDADLDAVGALAEELISREEKRLGIFHHHHHEEDGTDR